MEYYNINAIISIVIHTIVNPYYSYIILYYLYFNKTLYSYDY